MGTPEEWPVRPAFGRFTVEIVDKPDGRHAAYYEWPDEADGQGPAGDGADDRDLSPRQELVDGV